MWVGRHLLAANEQYTKALQDAEDEILKLKQSLEILKQDSKEDLREIQTLQNTLQIAESRILELTKQNTDLKNANDILQKSNEQAISYLQKLTPQPCLQLIEIHLAESCNLNCFSCSHFSQLATNEMPNIQSYEN